MDIPFDYSMIFRDSPIQRLDRGHLMRLHPRKYWAVQKGIDQMGELSMQAQGLKRILTSYQKILDQEDEQTVYIFWEKDETRENHSQLIGLLKIGRKKLYLMEESGRLQYEETPICILDFYVHESKQRQGFGHQLFDFMLKSESCNVWDIAIDRPSEPFLQFLEKFYKLTRPVWQNTNFVVYPAFFENRKHTAGTIEEPSRRGARSQKYSRESSPTAQRGATPRAQSRSDSMAGCLYGDSQVATRREVGPDTPLGRKNIRDYGHQSIW